MPRFKVYWTERHSLWVAAANADHAAEIALREYVQSPSCDYQTIESVDQATNQEMAILKADREEGCDD